MAAEQLVLGASGADPTARSDSFTIHTDVFDGPLDLLLYLVKRDGIALARVEVGRIADAYLAWIDKVRSLDLSVAADFLFMAATLVHLKSLHLLPLPAGQRTDRPCPHRPCPHRPTRGIAQTDHAEQQVGPLAHLAAPGP